MADTQPLAPTDADIDALWVGQQLTVPQLVQRRVIARAALAKWGAPQPVPASAAEFALRALVAAGHVTQERVDQAMALPGAPAQPVAVPLTDEAARKQGGV